MPISALPTPPSRQDPANFNDRADTFLAALPLFQSEANTLQTDVNAKQVAANTSAVNAAASELASANTAGATIWVSGTTYAIGANRFSPINYLTYRRKTAGAGTTDPSLDATNWQLLTGLGNTTLQAVYPVGSIYINASVNTNPATLFGFGTWVAFAAGRVMIGLDGSDSSFDTLEETGGSKDATLVSHSHTGTTGNENQNHTHSFSGTTSYIGDHQHYPSVNGNTNGYAFGGDAYNVTRGTTDGLYQNTPTTAAGGHSHSFSGNTGGISVNHQHDFTTATVGSSATNANLQPYITVCMWKRTA